MRTRTAAAAVLLVLSLAACGDDAASDPDPDVAAPASSPSQQTTTQCESAPPTAPAPAAATSDLTKKPAVEIPDTPPPCGLQVSDIVVGKGAEAKTGQQVTMQYVGVLYADGEQFDASWDRGAPFGPFQLGAGNVIAGWDEGIPGMKVGGRRILTIPPDKGYGPQGTPDGTIPPGATLVFVVDLVAVS